MTKTDRTVVRELILAGRSMDYCDWLFDSGLINYGVWNRIRRIFAWSVATDHPMTRNVSLEKWRSRRYRIKDAIKKIRIDSMQGSKV